jgi:hypothetical protein
VKFAPRSLVPTCPPLCCPERSSSSLFTSLASCGGPLFSQPYKLLFPPVRRGLGAQALCFDHHPNCHGGVPLWPLCSDLSASALPFLRDLYGLCFQRFAASLALLALFFGLPFFVFSNFQPLFAKYPGWGVSPPSLRTSALSAPRLRLFTQSLQKCVVLIPGLSRSSGRPLTRVHLIRLSTVNCRLSRLPSHNAKIHSNSL